jgi:phage shock protein E
MSPALIILLVLAAGYILYAVIKSRRTGLTIQKAIASGALVVDVRSPEEFAAGHFSSAINIPYDRIEKRIKELGEDKARPVILYCYAGSRSAAAERVLRSRGFGNVINARNLENLRKFDKAR